MKKILEALRNGDGKVKLSERGLETIDSPLSYGRTLNAITNFNLWDSFWYPRYLQIGASAFDVRDGKQSKVPSLSFDAEMVAIGADVPESVVELDLANLPPQRVGVSIPMDTELISSMSDTQLMSFLLSGIYAIQEEIFALMLVKAFDKGANLGGAFDVPGMIGLQEFVKSNGYYFGSSNMVLNGKKTPIVTGGDTYIFEGNAFTMAKSWDDIYAFGSKKINDDTTLGFGDFKFAAVLLYSDYNVIIDRYTGAKNGKVIYTFYQMANVGITDKTKFAYNMVSAPFIVNQPIDANVTEGNTLVLSVDGYGADSYIWKKGGVPLADGGNISGSTTRRLVINNVAIADAGVYTVDLVNGIGTTVSNDATVTIDQAVVIDLNDIEIDINITTDDGNITDIDVDVDIVPGDGDGVVDVSVDINWNEINATSGAKRLMKAKDIDPSMVNGSLGGGRIGKQDVTDYLSS